jgi:hypothetical protein
VVANIRSGSSPGGALYYNKEKVDKDEAEVLFWQKMLEPFDKHGRMSSLQVREIGNDRMQQIAELAEQFTKIKLHMPPGSHLDMEDQDIAEIWREELIAILHSQDIPQH